MSKSEKEEDLQKCLFSILVLNKNKEEELLDLFRKYNNEFKYVDTVEGCWNLNDDWIEIDNLNCTVEYDGVYPINWDSNDLFKLRELYYNRDIFIIVHWKNTTSEGKIEYIPNH